MQFHAELGPVPKVGLELEVVEWEGDTTDVVVASKLEAAGFMPNNVYSQGEHAYHCTCETCHNIGSEAQFPVMWKMQYDASLPVEGAEFISSPFPVQEFFVENAMHAMQIISEDAVWSVDLPSRDGAAASPGLHVHCHVAGPEIEGFTMPQLQNALRVYKNYIPELFLLADAAGVRRRLEFRLPTIEMNAGGLTNGHHNFLALAGEGITARRDDRTSLRLEWRLFEAAYENTDYLRGTIYLCAALTQLIVRRQAFSSISGVGALELWDDRECNSVDQIVEQWSETRFNFLREAVLSGTGLRDDPVGQACVDSLFTMAERNR